MNSRVAALIVILTFPAFGFRLEFAVCAKHLLRLDRCRIEVGAGCQIGRLINHAP